MYLLFQSWRCILQIKECWNQLSSLSFFRLDNDYGPREYGKSNETLPSTQTSPLFPVKNVRQTSFQLTFVEMSTLQQMSTETELNWHKAKCKERDGPFDNNEQNISSTSNDDTTACRTIEYTWLQTGNTVSSSAIDIIHDKVLA